MLDQDEMDGSCIREVQLSFEYTLESRLRKILEIILSLDSYDYK